MLVLAKESRVIMLFVCYDWKNTKNNIPVRHNHTYSAAVLGGRVATP